MAVEPYASGAQTTTATATAKAADGFETGGQVRFSIGSWSKLAHLNDGAATVTLPTSLDIGALNSFVHRWWISACDSVRNPEGRRQMHDRAEQVLAGKSRPEGRPHRRDHRPGEPPGDTGSR